MEFIDMKLRTLNTLIIVSAILVGCDPQNSEVESRTLDTSQTKEKKSSSLEGLLATSEPTDALSIRTLKSDDNIDKEVVVIGRIGGRVEPFVENRAMFMMADLELEMCTAEGDHCETPWDACCETPENIIASAITVQVKDKNGNLIKEDLRALTGLKSLAKITVQGKVAEQSEQVVVLDAKSIFVHP